ncbi:MAG: NADH dehydrogenase [Paracoccaceae bacterium]|jgi:NADH dehydrogenase
MTWYKQDMQLPRGRKERSAMSKLVTIFGGSGFVGRYIARRMAKQGWRVRIAVRRPYEAGFVRTYGVVGQVEPILCNIRDETSVADAIRGADAVVNCVGILAQAGKNTFAAVQVDGAARIARVSAAQGVGRMVHVSAIGADETSDSQYARTKAAGEQAVLEHMPQAVILRPSIVFGSEDGFFNRFASMSRLGPILPVVGADTRFQPVFVDDVAAAAVQGVLGEAKAGVYELGGPQVSSFRDLMQSMLKIIRRRKLIVNVPFFIADLMGLGFDFAGKISGGLIPAMVTRDQVKNLRKDNVVGAQALGFAALGIVPTPMEAVLPEYLWRFRPAGQYEVLKESARNLNP